MHTFIKLGGNNADANGRIELCPPFAIPHIPQGNYSEGNSIHPPLPNVRAVKDADGKVTIEIKPAYRYAAPFLTPDATDSVAKACKLSMEFQIAHTKAMKYIASLGIDLYPAPAVPHP